MEIQSKNVTLQWDELSTSEMAGPRNTYSLSVSGYSPSPLSDLMNTKIPVRNLCPYSNYNISIKACNIVREETMCGPSSPAIQVQTSEGGKY